MVEEIKRILDDLGNKDNYIEEFGYQYKRINLYDSFQLLDYITNLQQDLDKANDIIEKDRQFNQGRLLDIAKLKEENERLKEINKEQANHLISKDNLSYEDYKSRCNKAIEYIEENYPTSTINYQDDKYKLINILKGEDEKSDI